MKIFSIRAMKIFPLKPRFAFNEQSLADPLRLNVNLSSSICVHLKSSEKKANPINRVSCLSRLSHKPSLLITFDFVSSENHLHAL